MFNSPRLLLGRADPDASLGNESMRADRRRPLFCVLGGGGAGCDQVVGRVVGADQGVLLALACRGRKKGVISAHQQEVVIGDCRFSLRVESSPEGNEKGIVVVIRKTE